MSIVLCGVINCTPDSFSDGDPLAGTEILVHKAHRLIADGAQIIDIGGDSTRPGSKCIGHDEEWARIAPVVDAITKASTVSVDTHHVETARRAIESGVRYINDVGGGRDPRMIEIIAKSAVNYIVMYSATGAPHRFDKSSVSPEEVVERVDTWFSSKVLELEYSGVSKERIVLDPGMGAFVSPDPGVSWALLRNYERFARHGCALMVGCSRKGFLKEPDETSLTDRDGPTALCGVLAAEQVNGRVPLILRVHDVATQRRYLNVRERFAHDG